MTKTEEKNVGRSINYHFDAKSWPWKLLGQGTLSLVTSTYLDNWDGSLAVWPDAGLKKLPKCFHTWPK